jgi:ribosome-binding ATPase YchF (GTP1/OBG family)
MTEKRLERLHATGHHGTPAEREANDREQAILTRLHGALVAGRPIRDEDLPPDEEKAIRGFRFLTQKPVLILLNIGEGDIPGADGIAADVRVRVTHRRTLVDALSARIEMELGDLSPEEAAVFMEDLGIHGSSLDRVISLSYRLLGLISFLTAGPDEVRAWPIPDGSTAVDAAGAIHTDLARGFIRAETVAYDDLVALGSTAEARKHGKLRSEGKSYHVRDGDVIEILFSR